MPLLTELDDVCGRNSTKMPRLWRWTEGGLVAPTRRGEAQRRRKSGEGGREPFSCIHFGMADRRNEFGFDARPHLLSSPPGEEIAGGQFWFGG